MPGFKVSFWGVDKTAPRWERARPVMTTVDAPRAEDVAVVLGERWDKIKGLNNQRAQSPGFSYGVERA